MKAEDGWIKHDGSDKCPVDGTVAVEVCRVGQTNGWVARAWQVSTVGWWDAVAYYRVYVPQAQQSDPQPAPQAERRLALDEFAAAVATGMLADHACDPCIAEIFDIAEGLHAESERRHAARKGDASRG